MSPVKIVVEQDADGFIAQPLGMTGVVVGQGDSIPKRDESPSW
jgi:hypothetical protein